MENGIKEEKKRVMTGKKMWEYSIVPQFSDTSAHSLPSCSVKSDLLSL